MADVKIDKTLFHERLSSLLSQWKTDKRTGDAVFGGVGSIAILVGKTDDSVGFVKNNAFQFWLLGYEFPATLMLLTPETVYIVTTKKKASHLESLQGGKVALEILTRGKDADENTKIFERCTQIIKDSGNKHGVLSKIPATGPFAEEWQKAYEEISKDVEEVDIAPAMSAAMAGKDEKELRTMRDAARASSALMKDYFVEEMAEILDAEKKVTHKALFEKLNNKLDDAKFFQKAKVSANFDPGQIDWAWQPSIQSGGNYDLKLNSEADDNNLHAGVILAAFGLRYQTYASLLARTYLVNPTTTQEKNYKLLLEVHEAVLKSVRDGVTAKSVYEKALSIVKAKKPDLEKNFMKNVGAGIGIEARDATLVLNAKNNRTLRDGMTLTVTTGFSDLNNPEPQDKKSGTYALMLTDTIRVSQEGNLVIFTKDAPSDLDSIAFYFRDEEEDKPATPKKKKDSRVGGVATQNITKSRLRAERTTNQDAEKEAARREHQKELHDKKHQQGLEKYKQDTGSLNGTEAKTFKQFRAYTSTEQFPTKVRDLAIVVDYKQSSVVLPIMGRPVPFHINTVKNVSKNDESGFAYLRINFLSPGQGVGRKDDQPFEDPNAHFVRSLTFRSKDVDRMERLAKDINDLKTETTKRERTEKDQEDVVKQDAIKLSGGAGGRNRNPNAKMPMIFLRPALEGKRLHGEIEIHENGIRYTHQTGQTVDVLFSNIKHLFFQPCDHELIVIIHVYLNNPIMIGKRKTNDVQFYREATEMAFDETGNRKRKHRYGDEEEFEAEQEERRRRAQLNREFKAYAERIADAGRSENLSVDMPFRELGFQGVPFRSNVLMQPTTDCLIQVTEPPFTVVTLSEIEVVHLERVQFGLKNFDMVVVFHDFKKNPVHINSIPVESLDGVKDWLDSVDIPFSEGPLNLNWQTIMKTVTADPHTFFKEGGWSFLNADSDDEEGGDDEDDEESAFEMDDSEVAELSEEESEDESEFDDDASADASDEDVDDLSEEGEDWDELEKKAQKKDKDSGLDDGEGRKKKRK